MACKHEKVTRHYGDGLGGALVCMLCGQMVPERKNKKKGEDEE